MILFGYYRLIGIGYSYLTSQDKVDLRDRKHYFHQEAFGFVYLAISCSLSQGPNFKLEDLVDKQLLEVS
jgi:hypothetical protein